MPTNKSLQSKLSKLEDQRGEMLYDFRNELNDENAVDALYNHHMLNLKEIEYVRKEK
jgi:hypothetical protein